MKRKMSLRAWRSAMPRKRHLYSLRPSALRGATHLLHEPAVPDLCKRGRLQSHRGKPNGFGGFALRYFPKSFVGKTCDKLGAIKATVAWTGVSILSFLLLIFGGSNETVSIIAAGVNDVMFAIVGTAMPMILLSLFGSRDFGRVYSIICSAGYVVGAFGMPVMMKVYGMAGSFQGVFVFCIICNLLIATFALVSGLLNKTTAK